MLILARRAIQQLVRAAPADALKIFDINLRLTFYSREVIEQSMRLSNVLKLNNEELSTLTQVFSIRGNVRHRIEWFIREFGFKAVVLTSGSRGSQIHQGCHWSEVPARPVKVVDSVGAGDAFAAALIMGLLSKMDLGEAHAIAAEVARCVCAQTGATPPMPKAFRSRFSRSVT